MNTSKTSIYVIAGITGITIFAIISIIWAAKIWFEQKKRVIEIIEKNKPQDKKKNNH